MNKSTMITDQGNQGIQMSRVFDTPRERLFEVYTDPKHIPHWWGPAYLTTIIDKMDPKAGGQWRFVQRDQKGNEYAFHGVYHAVVPSERIVNTFEFEGTPGHVMLETAVFESLPDGKTRLTATSVFQTLADRDAMVSEGMEAGARESWERLAALVGKSA